MSNPEGPHVVTLSSLYGTGDVEIGRQVAERLGVTFVDREIPAFVAQRLGVSESDVAKYLEQRHTFFERLIESLGRAPVPSQESPPERLDEDAHRYKAEVEKFCVRTAGMGGVILGRAAALVLQAVPGALHVRLVGPRAERVRRVMASEGLDERAAARRVNQNDTARAEYGQRLYGVDPADLALYHLVIDSTAFDISACVELIVHASEARARGSRVPSPTNEPPRGS